MGKAREIRSSEEGASSRSERRQQYLQFDSAKYVPCLGRESVTLLTLFFVTFGETRPGSKVDPLKVHEIHPSAATLDFNSDPHPVHNS